MALTKAEKRKLGEGLNDIEDSLREVDTGDRQPLNSAHNRIQELRDEHEITDEDNE